MVIIIGERKTVHGEWYKVEYFSGLPFTVHRVPKTTDQANF